MKSPKQTKQVSLDFDNLDSLLDDNDVGSTTDVEGAVPSWTWGVIIGIVVVAFVAGAFILSRGGDGEDGKDWDY